MYDIPSKPNIEKCIVTEGTVLGTEGPKVVEGEKKEIKKPVAKKKRQQPHGNKETA